MATATKTKRSAVKQATQVEVATPEYVSITWFAKKFNRSRSMIHKACKAGRINSIPLPSAGEKQQRGIPYSEVEKWEAGLGLKK